jgi:transposase
LKIIQEVENNPGEKRVDIAKRLGLSATALNSILAKKDEIREPREKCGNACKKRKTDMESTFAELEIVLFTWYQQARTSNIPIDGTTLSEIAKIIAAQLNIDNFIASSGWISRFKNRHGLVFKKQAGESAEVSVESIDAWLESLPSLLEGYKPRDVYNADEIGKFFNVFPDRTLAYKGESCHGRKHSKDRFTVLLCVNSDGSDKHVPIVIGKSPKPRCFKKVKKTAN